MGSTKAPFRARILVVLLALTGLMAVTSSAAQSAPPPEARLWCTRELPCAPGTNSDGWCLYAAQILRCR